MRPSPALRLALALALLAAPLAARPVEVGGEEIPLGPRATHLLDAAGTATVEEVLARGRAGTLAPFGGPVRSFGPTQAAVWLHARVTGAGEDPDLAFTWDRPLVDWLDLWVIRAGRVEHLRGGLAVPSAERTIAHLGLFHVARLDLSPGETVDLVVRAQSRRILLAEAHLRPTVAVHPRDLQLGGYYGLLAGIMALATLLGAWSWWALRDRWSLRLTALLATFAGYIGAESGLLAALWPGWPRWWDAAPSVAAVACAVLGLAYTRAFVGSQARLPRLDRLARLLQWCGAPLLLLPLAWPAAGAIATILLVGATFSLMMVMGVLAVRTGERPARYFLASATVISVVGAVYLLALLGLGPATHVTLGGFQVALFVGGVVLLLSLFDRVNVARAQARTALETQVAERTASLRETVQRLEVEASERARVESALREAQERFQLAFDTSPDAIAINRLGDARYVAINQGFTRLTGWTEADLLGRPSTEMGIWADPADRARLVAGLRARGRVENLEAGFTYKDGKVRTGLMSAAVMSLGGEPHILSVTRDITDRQQAAAERDRLAEQLQQAQKLEAVGRLAGGVAHDFNNLLTAISTNASLALMDLPHDDQRRQAFEEILEATTKASSLTRQLLAFSRRQRLAPRPTDLAAVLAGMTTMLRRVLGEQVTLAVAPGPAISPVMADPGQVEQVLVNLAVNARDAMPGGGRIEVALEEAEVPAGAAPAGRAPGRYGVLVVRDHGLGIPAEVLPHVFEPFFTTKRGKGTGLGLATVHGIAAQHGGFVDVESAPGKGATFRVAFPLAAGPARPHAPATPVEVAFPGGTETVLLAEDERSVREATRSLLERLGYRVLVAEDGLAAEALACAEGTAFDLLLTDVVMPRLDGRALAERLRARFPGLPVVLMSGYSQDLLERAPAPGDEVRLVAKPYEPARLAEALREALDGRARG
jgi:PAS domain S-box-containing protein